MATAAEIRNKAANRLGIVGEGETLPSYETSDIDESYVEVYAQLTAKNIASWDFDEEVPDEYVPHVVAMVAYGRVGEYSIPEVKYQRLAADYVRSVGEIRELRTDDIYTQDQPDYF